MLDTWFQFKSVSVVLILNKNVLNTERNFFKKKITVTNTIWS